MTERAILSFGWLILGVIWLIWIGTRGSQAVRDDRLARRLKKEIMLGKWRDAA